MTKRENLLALLRREPYEEVPVDFSLCPDLVGIFKEKTGGQTDYQEYFGMPWRGVADIRLDYHPEDYRKFYPGGLKEGATIDIWGVAHEPGSEAAKHMTYMRNPMREMEDLEEIQAYPFPDFSKGDASHQKRQVEKIHARGLAANGSMQCTIWETAWYIRGMENLMVDMSCEPEIATWIFDKVTEQALIRTKSFARAGVDIIYLGDDIGMQNGPMMSRTMYQTWIKPRLKKVVDAIREINPDIIIFYHSCGTVTEFIPDLIECGIDVLNPIQSECMDFAEIYNLYGGLFVAPTHLLEPEVPWENIEAYVEACREYKVD